MRRVSISQAHHTFTIWFLFFLAMCTASACLVPGRILNGVIPPTQTPTASPTPQPSATSTRTPIPTWTATATSSPSPSPQPAYTNTPFQTNTHTPVSPTLTPGLNQLTIGQQVWQLKSTDFPRYISALGRRFSPPTRRDPSPAYVFLRMNFDCATGDSLIQGYAGKDMGLAFVHKQAGYPDISIEDLQGHKYLVTLMGACWLAAPIPKTRAQDGHFILNFGDSPPFHFSVEPAALEWEQKICLISDRDGTTEVFVANPDGSELERLTTDFSLASEPAWSPDHLRLAYVSQRRGNADIWIIDNEGNKLSTLSQTDFDEGGPAWSPKTEQIAFHSYREGNWEIYLTPTDFDRPLNLTSHLKDDMYPSWSPDGTEIAFQSNRDGDWEISIMSADGSRIHAITDDPGEDILPSWSPNGKWILFWSRRSGNWRLMISNPDGDYLRPLTLYENPGPSPSRAAWSPDGLSILISLVRERFLQLYTLRLDGNELSRTIDAPANFFMPDW